MNRADVIVIGGGASGMAAAIMAARNGADVMILEHMESMGKKLLATGNGKCNYTNQAQGMDKYYGDDPAFVLPVFEQMGRDEILTFFEELGIYPKEKNGYYYPYSGQAVSVQSVLLMELQRLHVRIILNCGIRRIQKEQNHFLIDAKKERYQARSCILATGGKTLKASGSDGSGFLYLDEFRHHIIDIVPGLVGLQAKQAFCKEIAGIRAEIKLDLYIAQERIRQETGELQMVDYGISGIPVFQISRLAAKALLAQKEVWVELDFMKDMEESDCLAWLCRRFHKASGKNAAESCIGLFPQKLIPVFLREAGISADGKAEALSELKIAEFVRVIKHFRMDIAAWNKFDSAQVTAGGVDTAEICPDTMESKLVPGLFFAGEMVDIDGVCGGYNLQWAWASGAVAGIHAAEKCAKHTPANEITG